MNMKSDEIVVYFIKEEEYQKIKKKMRKSDDYFTLKECKIMEEKISVILA